MPGEAHEDSSAMDHSDRFSGIQVADLIKQVDLERDPAHMVAMKFAYFICIGVDVLKFVDQDSIRSAIQSYISGLKLILPNHGLSDVEILQIFRFVALLRMNDLMQQVYDQIDAQRLNIALRVVQDKSNRL